MITILSLSSCNNSNNRYEIRGSGQFVERTITDIDGESLNISNIEVRDNNSIVPVNVFILSGLEKSITISAQENLIDSISVDNQLSLISIYGDEKCYYSTSKIDVYIKGFVFDTIELELSNAVISNSVLANNAELRLSKASEIKANSFEGKSLIATASDSSNIIFKEVNTDKVKVNLDSSSSINLSSGIIDELSVILRGSSIANLEGLESKQVSIDAADASSYTTSGKCQNIDLVFSGSSVYSGKNFIVDMATIIISGSSKITLNAVNGINVVASGSSEVVYYGNATITQTSITGSSVITRGE